MKRYFRGSVRGIDIWGNILFVFTEASFLMALETQTNAPVVLLNIQQIDGVALPVVCLPPCDESFVFIFCPNITSCPDTGHLNATEYM